MIQAISSSNSGKVNKKNINSPNQQRQISQKYITKSQADTLAKANKPVNIAFTGYYYDDLAEISDDFCDYGTQADRNATREKILLTPDDIVKKVNSRESFDIHYNMLSDETKKTGLAIKGAKNICSDVLIAGSKALDEVAKANPKYSGIPIVGLLVQGIHNATGDFEKDIKGTLNVIETRMNRFLKICWDMGLNPIYTDYLSASNEFAKKTRYAKNPTEAAQAINEGKTTIIQSYNEIFNKIVRPAARLVPENRYKIITKQENRQGISIARRTLTCMLTGGLDGGKIDLAASTLVDLLNNSASTAITDSFLNSGVERLIDAGLKRLA